MYTLYAGTARMLLHINGKFTMGKFVVVSFLTNPHWQCLGVCQCMKHT